MSRSQPSPPPACYALVHPGLEAIAAEEIESDLGGEVKKTGLGVVVFRVPKIDERLLALRTTEDVFLLAWGSDQLTHRAEDLERIRRWTAREADWPSLLRLHHTLRPKPKGRPTYRLVAQMEGQHGYQRRDARKALAQGLTGKLPASWRPAEENAAVEFWLTIHGATAVCGLRLSDRSMRHRAYKLEHRPASLRPTLAAAMVRLADIRPGHVVLDPMCGAGTLLAERLAVGQQIRGGCAPVWGGDLDFSAVRAAAVNLRRLGSALLTRWDAAATAARLRDGGSSAVQSAVRQATEQHRGDCAALPRHASRVRSRSASGRFGRADRQRCRGVAHGRSRRRLERTAAAIRPRSRPTGPYYCLAKAKVIG